MTRKKIATEFLSLAAIGKIDEAYDRYVHKDFIHHNPWFPGDRESLKNAMKESHNQMPNKMFKPIRVLEDGDLVPVHSRLVRASDVPEIAVVHILRFDGDQIIEEWEAAMEVPKDSPNKNGIF